MHGQSTVNPSTNSNEQLIGKFHVVNVDKLPINPVNSHEETIVAAPTGAAVPPAQAPPSSAVDESACASRFQMIRVDRNFARGRWKVNDYEPPENTSTSINPPVNTIENDPVNISSSTTLTSAPITTAAPAIPNNAPPGLPVDSTMTSSATLAATAASAAAAAATAFQQQRLVLNNQAANVMPPANVPPPAGLLHAYPPGTLPNIAAPNQSYLLPNHQFGYYPFFPSHYAPYPHQWAHMPPTNPYLPPPHPHPHQQQQQATQQPPGNLGDGIRYGDTVVEVPNENPVISSNQFSNPATDHLQNAQMAAAAAAAAGPFLYSTHHAYVPQAPPTNASPYATIASYHPGPQLPTIVPPHQQPLSLAQPPPTNAADPSLSSQQPQLHQALLAQQQQQQQQQPAPILTSPKHDASSAKTSVQPAAAPKTAAASVPTNLPKPLTTAANGANNDALRAVPNSTQITDLLSSSPSISNSQPPPSLLSPITVQTNNSAKTPTASLNDIWTYAAGGSPLNVSQTAAQTAAVTAVAAMGLLSNESAKNNEIANEILKELTTPTKQNNTTDIDNKISAAMDLVKMHLLSAVREEVTELRQQIRILNEKVTSVEHENAFLRQHVPSEIYAQYTPLFVGTSTANDSSNSTTNTTAAAATTTATTAPPVPLSSSQPISSAAVASLPSSVAQQASASTTSQVPTLPPPPASINLPPT